MQFVDILSENLDDFLIQYQPKISLAIRETITSMLSCKTMTLGCSQWRCDDCTLHQDVPLSCGHRSCSLCQHNTTQDWLNRQQLKLLDVDYYMVTFTLPFQVRPLAFQHQQAMFDVMFKVASGILKDFGTNKKGFQANIGFTGVLHTHSRKRDFHPHIHFVIPGGGYNAKRKQWVKNKGKYLFNSFNLANVWRGRMLQAIKYELNLPLPRAIPKKWVVNCQNVGKGLPALKYLSRYLYRGVLPDNDIIKVTDKTVSFRYTDSATKQSQVRTLPTVEFLWLILQHVIPKGFRRVRDYGFLHGAAKRLLRRIQLCLMMAGKLDFSQIETIERKKAMCLCKKCHQPMQFWGIVRPSAFG